MNIFLLESVEYSVLINRVEATHQTPDPETLYTLKKNRKHRCLDTNHNFILYLI